MRLSSVLVSLAIAGVGIAGCVAEVTDEASLAEEDLIDTDPEGDLPIDRETGPIERGTDPCPECRLVFTQDSAGAIAGYRIFYRAYPPIGAQTIEVLRGDTVVGNVSLSRAETQAQWVYPGGLTGTSPVAELRLRFHCPAAENEIPGTRCASTGSPYCTQWLTAVPEGGFTAPSGTYDPNAIIIWNPLPIRWRW